MYQEIISEARHALTRGERTSGTQYVYLKDDAPDWMHDLVYAAHDNGEFGPDDARYLMIEAAIDVLDENYEEGESLSDCAAYLPSATDAAYSDVVEWLSSYAGVRLGYCDDAAEEMGLPQDASTFTRLAYGMDYEQAEVFASVVASIEAQVNGQ